MQQSLQNSVRLGQHQGDLPFKVEFITSHFSLLTWERGRGRQGMHLPCKQAHVGALPTDSTISCGKLDQSTEMSLINSFRWVRLPLPLPSQYKLQNADYGIPPGALIKHSAFCILHSAFGGEVIRLPVCKTGVEKYYVGSDDWSITSASHHLNAE